MPRITSPRRVATAAGLAALAVAAPAQADSIAYVKGGDLWLSTSDGARQFQVTATGGYSTVSQSDLGGLTALHGDHIRTLDRDGKVLHDILTPASSSMPGTQFRGPFDPVVSPNGLSVAYTWYFTEVSSSPSCNPANGCETVYGRQGTGYTRPDRITGFDEDGYRSQSGWVSPSWTTSGGTILSDPIQYGNEDVVVHTPGSGNGDSGGVGRWFFDKAAGGLRDVEQSPDGQKLAGVAGDEDDRINFYRAKGGYPTLPDACYGLSGDVGRYSQPSWSPDSTRLAFADDQGVHVLAIPDMKTDCGEPSEPSKLLIPGAKHPDWGPADVPAPRAVPIGREQVPGGGTTGTTGPTPPKDGPRGDVPDDTTPIPAPRARLRVQGGKLGAVLRKGLVVKLTGGAAGRRTITVRAGSRQVGRSTATVTKAGSASVRVRFTAKVRRSLSGKRSVRLTVTGAGASTTVLLKR